MQTVSILAVDAPFRLRTDLEITNLSSLALGDFTSPVGVVLATPSVFLSHIAPWMNFRSSSVSAKPANPNPSSPEVIQPEIVLVQSSPPDRSSLLQVAHAFRVVGVLSSWSDPRLEGLLWRAMENRREQQFARELELAVHEQNETLVRLQSNLQDRVEERRRQLQDALLRTQKAARKWSCLQQLALLLHQSTDRSDVLQKLPGILQPVIAVEPVRWIETLPSSDSLATHTTIVPLSAQPLGQIYGALIFTSADGKPWKREGLEFLTRVCELISLFMERSLRHQRQGQLQVQWRKTFDSVSEPMLVINNNYEVLQFNRAAQRSSSFPSPTSTTSGRKCFQFLFQRQSPCSGCNLGTSFRLLLDDRKTTWEVSSTPLTKTPSGGDQFVHQYRDITSQVQEERRQTESAKLLDMGILGSSIAHELNNPLGGALAYIQLLQKELPPEDPLQEDLQLMRSGAERCRSIIENLLNFTRSPEGEPKARLDFVALVKAALVLLEVKTRSAGIELRTTLPSTPIWVEGYSSFLSQALQNLLQASAQTLSDLHNADSEFLGLIEVRVEIFSGEVHTRILDNRPVGETGPAIGLAVAQQLIQDSGGKLEISSQTKGVFSAKIILPHLIV